MKLPLDLKKCDFDIGSKTEGLKASTNDIHVSARTSESKTKRERERERERESERVRESPSRPKLSSLKGSSDVFG